MLQRRIAPRQAVRITGHILAQLCRTAAGGASTRPHAALGFRPGKLHGIQIAFVMPGMRHDLDGLAFVVLLITHQCQPVTALFNDSPADRLQQFVLIGGIYQIPVYLAQRRKSAVGMFNRNFRLLAFILGTAALSDVFEDMHGVKVSSLPVINRKSA